MVIELVFRVCLCLSNRSTEISREACCHAVLARHKAWYTSEHTLIHGKKAAQDALTALDIYSSL